MDSADFATLQQAVALGNYRYTVHALQRTTERHITRLEIEQVVANAEVIEEYPQDKYGPSVLLFGETQAGRALHIHLCLPPSVKIITAYEPDPDQWDNYRVRK